jgi:DNA-directed RNA polymerase subunit RPC12/RpoP
MNADEYKCAMCGETFNKGWTDEEAAAEAVRNKCEVGAPDTAIVCDYCYVAMRRQGAPLVPSKSEAVFAAVKVDVTVTVAGSNEDKARKATLWEELQRFEEELYAAFIQAALSTPRSFVVDGEFKEVK